MAIESPKHFIAWVMGGYSFLNCYDSTKPNKLIFLESFNLRRPLLIILFYHYTKTTIGF